MQKQKILIVDDEEHIRELLKFNLNNSGYDTVLASNGIDALKSAETEKPDLVLLDIMIPDMDGIEVCKNIRKNKELVNTSIIMLTAKSEEIDKILGLELGADDYITKPFSIRELLARVKAVLRRNTITIYNKDESDIEVFGGFKIDFEKHEVIVDDKPVNLTLKEFELLEILIRNKGKILKRETLLDKVWGYEYIGETRTVDVHIRYIRKKIEKDDKNPQYIETVRGVGYRFNPNV